MTKLDEKIEIIKYLETLRRKKSNESNEAPIGVEIKEILKKYHQVYK